MLSFLSVGLLWALPLAGAPVLLHLFFLRRARKVPFSDLTLLRAVSAHTRPATRLRQWLLLLLRCLLIAFLVLVFSRPVIHRNASFDGGSERGLDMVILVDTSWSMGAVVRGRKRFDWTVSSGVELLGMLRPEDRVAVAGFSDRLEGELAWVDGRPAARELLQRLRTGERTTDIGAALLEAYAFLGREGRTADDGRRRKRIIAVLSDGAGHLFRHLSSRGVAGLEGYDPEAQLIGLRWDETIENAGFAEVRPGESAAGDERGVLQVRTALYGSRRGSWSVDMFLKGRRSDQRTLQLDEGFSSPVEFRLPPSGSGEQWGRFEMRQDALKADDVFYFSLRVQPKPKVLLLYGSPNYMEAGQGGYFLKKLVHEGKRLPYRLDTADLGRLSRIRLEDYSAVLLADFKRMGDGMPEALNRYVVRGGGLWIIAGTHAEPGTYLPLARLMPGSLGETRVFRGEGASLLPVEESIPAALKPKDFAWSEFELNRVAIGRRYALAPGTDAKVWFKDSTGRPLLVEHAFGRGRVLLWASSLDIGWTNLALKPVFPAWLDVGLRHLTRYSGREQWRTSRVGEPIVREWGAGEPAPSKVQVRGPDGRRSTLIVRDRRIEYPDTRAPGMYFLQAAAEGSSIEAYAVNVDRGGPEGDLSPRRDVPWSPLRPGSLKEDFLRSVYGREIRTGVLGFALLFLLAELLLSRPRAFAGRFPTSGGSAASARIGSAAVLIFLLCGTASALRAQEGDRFVWTQLRYTGGWDPYPNVHGEVLNFIAQVTSVIVAPERRVIALKDLQLFSSPYIVLSGKQAPPELDEEEIGRLRDYLTSGGFLWIEDASGSASSPFNRWVLRTLAKVLPDSDLKPLPSSHVLFKTFFLMRRIGGRVLVTGSVEGADWAGKTVVVYSRNDLLGAWAKDPLGKFLYECVPGGEAQRMEARKLSLNIILYALTGSYKADAVHQPFILQKMRDQP